MCVEKGYDPKSTPDRSRASAERRKAHDANWAKVHGDDNNNSEDEDVDDLGKHDPKLPRIENCIFDHDSFPDSVKRAADTASDTTRHYASSADAKAHHDSWVVRFEVFIEYIVELVYVSRPSLPLPAQPGSSSAASMSSRMRSSSLRHRCRMRRGEERSRG